MNRTIASICRSHNIELVKYSPLSGGDINEAYLLETLNGKLFLKLNSAVDFPEMFIKEAEGLKALRQLSVIKVPEVVATGNYAGMQYLILEYLERGKPGSKFWQKLAEGMAVIHKKTNPVFGWTSSNYIGSLQQLNNWVETWDEFYTTQRILPLIKILFERKQIDKTDLKSAEELCLKFGDIFPSETPSLLHGDLWSGNFMAVIGEDSPSIDHVPSIFDPAVYFGHREMDLGMSLLFDGFDKTFYDAYNEILPLEKGWNQRVSLTQLYPLLVHAILFGGSYISSCKSIIREWTH